MKQPTAKGPVQLLVEEVLAHKHQIADAEAEIARIQAVIAERQLLVAKAQDTVPAVPDRQQERNAIMADIALGCASDGDLQAINRRIAEEIAAVEAAQNDVAPALSTHQATIDGLLKKLNTAQTTLAEIQSRTNEVAKRYFSGQAEIAAAEYVNHALALKELHLRITGLSSCIINYGGSGVMGYSTVDIQIPKLGLPQFDAVEGFPSNEPSVLLLGKHFRYGATQQAAIQEEEKFKSLLLDQLNSSESLG